VNKSTGPFDALFCVGQFFHQTQPQSPDGELGELSDYLQGRAAVPIPTYFTGAYGGGVAASHLLSEAVRHSAGGFQPQGIQICPNLYWLRGSAKFSLRGSFSSSLLLLFSVYHTSYIF
jgi:hypothetical protein